VLSAFQANLIFLPNYTNMHIFNKIKKISLTSLFFLPLLISAQNIKNPLGSTNSLFGFLNKIIDALLQLGAVVAAVAVIYAGFMFVTAQGDEGKIKTAKATLLYTVIGLAILLGARVIASVIENTIRSVGGSI